MKIASGSIHELRLDGVDGVIATKLCGITSWVVIHTGLRVFDAKGHRAPAIPNDISTDI